MKKSFKLIEKDCESSAYRTPQYLEFHRTFKRELTALLKPYVSKIEVSKPNHFDVTGFFELLDGRIYFKGTPAELNASEDPLIKNFIMGTSTER